MALTTSEEPGAAGAADPRIDVLDRPEPGFEGLTFARYRRLGSSLGQAEAGSRPLALGAWARGELVGMALLSRPFGDGADRRLLSIRVASGLRRRGLGRRLLAAAAERAAALGARKLRAFHSSQLPGREAYEALLRVSGWSRPVEVEQRFVGQADWSLRALPEWAPFLARLERRGYRSTTWGERTTRDRVLVEQLAHALPEADRGLDPRITGQQALRLVPELSVVLHQGEAVVGWILCSRAGPEAACHYTHGYVVPAVRRAGWLLGGIHDVSRRQVELFGGHTATVFQTAAANRGMRHFAERHLAPFAWTDICFLSEKALPPGD